MPLRLHFSRPGHLPPLRFGPATRQRIPRRYKSSHTKTTTAPPPASPTPVDDYYALLLAQPLPVTATSTTPPRPSTSTSASQASSSPSSTKAETIARARVVFGSRLAGPAARQRAKEEQGTIMAGVKVPPKPIEPDNCCMSGCVNCVWDGYREDLEEWVAARDRGRRAMAREQSRSLSSGGARSMDDDGGGRETNWSVEESVEVDDVLKDIPVGIREFMRTEKRLGERKRVESAGG